MSLPRRNGRFLVFRRAVFNRTEVGYYQWLCARVEQGQLNILITDKDWKVVMTGAQLMAAGKIGEFHQWLLENSSAQELRLQ